MHTRGTQEAYEEKRRKKLMKNVLFSHFQVFLIIFDHAKACASMRPWLKYTSSITWSSNSAILFILFISFDFCFKIQVSSMMQLFRLGQPFAVIFFTFSQVWMGFARFQVKTKITVRIIQVLYCGSSGYFGN